MVQIGSLKLWFIGSICGETVLYHIRVRRSMGHLNIGCFYRWITCGRYVMDISIFIILLNRYNRLKGPNRLRELSTFQGLNRFLSSSRNL